MSSHQDFRDANESGGAEGTLGRRKFLACGAAGAIWAGQAALPFSGGASQEPPAKKAVRSSPLAMWALTGKLQSADVLHQLDAFRGAGWGVVLYPRWGLELDYLGEAWMERIRFIVEAAASREMEVWLYDEFCWPSGHAKGLVTQGHDELTAALLDVQPDGRSQVLRVPGSANLLQPEATRRFLEVTHQRYAEALGPFFGRCVRAIFTDEPSLAMQHQPRPKGANSWLLPWSDALDRELGGDFRARLTGQADLAVWPGWRDYWASFSQVFHHAWVDPIARWCQSHGIAFTGHLLGEGSFGSQVAYNGSLRRQLSAFGIPGIDEISTRTDPSNCEALTLASIAEFPGRERMVEVYALGPPSMKLDTMRKMVNLCAACGVDRYVLAICPHDLSGSVFKREYLGIHGPQQPWFRDVAPIYSEFVAEAAERARTAAPLGVPWPEDEELWRAAGPDPKRSKALQALTETFVRAAREAIRARLPGEPASGITAPEMAHLQSDSDWSFQPLGLNSLRLDGSTLTIREVPARAELSVQSQLVRSLSINGTAVDLGSAPADPFDLSYRRLSIAHLLRKGANDFAVDASEAKPLRFLPGLILWGDFAVDSEGSLVTPPATIPLGDWRQHGYPAFCGTGRYRGVIDLASPPAGLTVDSGGYPVRVVVNGKEVGMRAWPPFEFDLRGVVQQGRNEVVIDVISTVGHLFAPSESPPVGLLRIGTR